MTTTAVRRTMNAADAPSQWRQMAALIRMELLLLRRNRTATVLSVATPLVVALLLIGGYDDPEDELVRVCGVIGMIAVFCVHHHLATVYASRRQEMVLKRLRAGLPSDRTILAGTASAAVLVFLVQAVLIVAYGVVVLDMAIPVNPVTMVVALLLGAAVLAALAAALSAVTRSAEAAMLTTMPTVTLFLLSPGVLVPLGALPESMETVAAVLPMGLVTEILRDGWLGGDIGSQPESLVTNTVAALPQLALLVAWLVVAVAVATRTFRWEPRQS